MATRADRARGDRATRVGAETDRPQKSRKGTRTWVKVIKTTLVTMLAAFLTTSIVGLVYMMQKLHEAQSLVETTDDRIRFDSTRKSVILSKDGKVLYEAVPERREPVLFKDVPEIVRHAVLAAEDRRFYEHGAVDYIAVGRVVSVLAKNRRASQGGSTITMQLAKLLFSSSEKTAQRKLQDVAVAEELERKYTKDQIFTMYMNVAYFGEGATGIAAASRVYFGKPVSELTIGEAAMLARCVRRPSDENPAKNYAKALENAHTVLATMRDQDWLTEQEYEKAMKEKPSIAHGEKTRVARILRAPYYVASILAELKARSIDIRSGGYTIYTTLDTQMQERTEQAVRDIVRNYRDQGVTCAAFVLVDRDGKILSEVGGTDYRKNRFNIVTQSALQPGSSFKPIMYATALQNGVINEDSELSNVPLTTEVRIGRGRYYHPQNSSRTNWGSSVPLRVAFANSINIPAVRTILATKPSAVVKVAEDSFGFRNPGGKWIQPVPSLALGTCSVTPLAMAEAYSVFMNGGTRVRPYAIDRVIGPEGDVVFRTMPARFDSGIKPDVCRVIDELMRAVVERGTGTEAQSIEGARGKTGTTNDAKDAWFCGYAQNLIGIGWIGNPQVVKGRIKRLPMDNGVFGGTVTVRMWTQVMSMATQRYGTSASPNVPAPREDRPRREKPIITTEDKSDDEPAVTIDESNGADAPEPEAPPIPDAPTPPKNDPPTDPGTDPAGDPAVPAADPTVRAPERRTRARKRADDNEMVEVEICADSGALATPYCPETITRSFAKSRRPRSRCPIHRGG